MFRTNGSRKTSQDQSKYQLNIKAFLGSRYFPASVTLPVLFLPLEMPFKKPFSAQQYFKNVLRKERKWNSEWSILITLLKSRQLEWWTLPIPNSPGLRVNLCHELRQVIPQVRGGVRHFFYRKSSRLTELPSQENMRMGDPHWSFSVLLSALFQPTKAQTSWVAYVGSSPGMKSIQRCHHPDSWSIRARCP